MPDRKSASPVHRGDGDEARNDEQPPARAATASKRRGGRNSRRKSDRAERALVRFLQERSFAAERVPRSGSDAGDLTVPLIGIDRSVEVKVRASGFRQLYRWLEGRDLLIVRADRGVPLVVIPLPLAISIATVAELARMRGCTLP